MPSPITRHHAEWLSLLEISGPFLSMPVLLNAFPQGLDDHPSAEARQRDRLDGMQKLLAERRDKEISDIHAVLGELQAMIERELDEPEYTQLEFWSTSEREQYNRNIQALRLRLKQIPEEMEKEITAIQARYADPQPRLFPVAVTFLVPEKYA